MPSSSTAVHPFILIIASVIGAAAVLALRLRETKRPVSARKIIVPPLAMSTGFSMFLTPAARVPWSYALLAFAFGALVLSYPLARTSRLIRQGDQIVMQRSRAFLWILLGLFVLRLALRTYVGRIVTPLQTGGLFFILAFGMIMRWRISLLLEYLRLRDERRPAQAR
jgi:membrane protein CcdC involved in cytochrome C biogenesis